MGNGNQLYYGDNLDVLRRYVKDESVDLVYLDPPFNSNQNYNVLFAEQDGSRSAAQIKAFGDTWRWDQGAAYAFQETVEAGGRVAQAMLAFQTLLGESDMLAYLAMMAPRLVELHRALKSTGSLYLHCDPTASHYLKLVLDAIFDPRSFRNEIVWKRTTAHSSANKFAPVHDTIFYYGKSSGVTWNQPRISYEPAYLDKYYRFDDGDGRLYWRDNITGSGTRNGSSGNPWRGINPSAIGRHWAVPYGELDRLDAAGRIYWPHKGTMPQYKRYRDELKGKVVADLWDDIDRINPVGSERLGYPTQKPLALLERIINASSNPGEVVLDPFCGCGTAIAAAQKLGRRWTGIDITHLAVGLIKHRLLDTFGSDVTKGYTVVGEPTTVEDAGQLAREDPFQFQAWALGLVGARTADSNKKGADKGVDGRLFFHDEVNGKTKQMIFSVKAGKLHAPYLRDLRGVIDRERAEIGTLLSLDSPTQAMRTEAASAGFYASAWGMHPRLQTLTIAELLAGKTIDYPRGANVTTFKKAPRAKPRAGTAVELPLVI